MLPGVHALAGDRPSEGNRRKPVQGLSPSLGVPWQSHPHCRRAAMDQITALALALAPFTAYSAIVLPSGSRVQAARDFPSHKHRFLLCSLSGPVCWSPSRRVPSPLSVPCLGKSLPLPLRACVPALGPC